MFAYEDSMKEGAYGFKVSMSQFSLSQESNEVLNLVEIDVDKIASEIFFE